MQNRKRIYHYGQQQTEEWHNVRLGKFTSSTIYNLFNEPTKKERAIEVVKRMRAGTNLDHTVEDIDYSIMTNEYMNYVWGYLYPNSAKTSAECKEAKKNLKDFIKGSCEINALGNELIVAITGIETIDIIAHSALNYIYNKALDIYYGQAEINAGGAACDWGNEWEPVASNVFKQRNLYNSDRVKMAFCEVEGLETGTSPDDTENKTTPSEYKCPKSRKIHMEHTKIKNDIELLAYDKQKYFQVHHQMFVLGSENAFWSSFDPRLMNNPKTAKKALHTIEIQRNEELCAMFEKKILMATKIRNEYLEELYK